MGPIVPPRPSASTFRYTIFKDFRALSFDARESTWAQLVDQLRTAPAVAKKADLPLIKGATYGNERSLKGSPRSELNMLEVSFLEVEHDTGEVLIGEAADRLRVLGLQAVLYTTARNINGQRWRMFLPLSQPIALQQREGFTRALDDALDGCLAPESHTSAQAWYFGRVEGVPFEMIEVDGEPHYCPVRS